MTEISTIVPILFELLPYKMKISSYKLYNSQSIKYDLTNQNLQQCICIGVFIPFIKILILNFSWKPHRIVTFNELPIEK